ncbi:hypothetical protein HYDPIDRAFT_24993 [Hydnomerulius pinastri MD-312]|nr:hypothetical protein HYDPIDRAFT_24993 [Hydnomerulius pinastri MD-312]
MLSTLPALPPTYPLHAPPSIQSLQASSGWVPPQVLADTKDQMADKWARSGPLRVYSIHGLSGYGVSAQNPTPPPHRTSSPPSKLTRPPPGPQHSHMPRMHAPSVSRNERASTVSRSVVDTCSAVGAWGRQKAEKKRNRGGRGFGRAIRAGIPSARSLSACPLPLPSRFILTYLFAPPDSAQRRSIEQRYGRSNVLRLVKQHQEDQENRKWMDESTMACPGCEMHIEKSVGCNHMNCWKCHTHFCYRCGGKINAANPYAHFSTPHTPCFSKLFDFVPSAEDGWQPVEAFEFI